MTSHESTELLVDVRFAEASRWRKFYLTQEKKILALLAEGKQSKEIADELFISSHTIDTHRRNLLKKTNCIDTTALITFAKMTGLI